MSKIICITGIDGSGKSTIIEELKKVIPDCIESNIWHLFSSGGDYLPFKSKIEIDNYLCKLGPDSRLLFLAHALKYSIEEALKKGKEWILTDSYIYKYFASEHTAGASLSMLTSLIQEFPVPDFVFKLNIDVKEAAKRKSKYSRYECGAVNQCNEKQFIEFQERILESWEIFDQQSWHLIDAQAPVKQKLAEIQNQLNI